MTSHLECPICLSDISNEKNSVVTNCGHCYHAGCLMIHVARNGFGCPYCRNNMVRNEGQTEEDNYENEDEEDEDYEDYEDYEEDEEPVVEPTVEPADEPVVCKKMTIEGKKYLINKKTQDVYDYENTVNSDDFVVVGLWDQVHSRIVEPFIY